ncbi:MAG: carbohydrate kinase family protein [Patescibacteria group bacterium]|nr:carbohydrate kinase family protein [Patescibacteria group bacterium]
MKIITIGSGTLDIIFQTEEQIIEGKKIDIKHSYFSLGGGALNAATTFRNLGINYTAYFRLGRDLVGKVIISEVKKEKLKTKIFFHSGDSQFSVVVLSAKSRFSERTVFVYRGLSDHFSTSDLEKVEKGDFYYYLTTANTSPDILLRFLSKIRRKARLISVNPSKKFLSQRESNKSLSLADIIFLNRDELISFLGRGDKNLELGKELVKKINPKIFVLTLGENGSITFYEDKIFIADVFKPRQLVDTTGAGDAFASAFFANLVIAKDISEDVIKKSIIWGSANSSANIEKLGAQIGLLRKEDYKRYKNLHIRTIKWKR